MGLVPPYLRNEDRGRWVPDSWRRLQLVQPALVARRVYGSDHAVSAWLIIVRQLVAIGAGIASATLAAALQPLVPRLGRVVLAHPSNVQASLTTGHVQDVGRGVGSGNKC
jgi:hypothetical protein